MSEKTNVNAPFSQKADARDTSDNLEKAQGFLGTTEDTLREYQVKFDKINEAKQAAKQKRGGGLFSDTKELAAEKNFADICKGVTTAASQVSAVRLAFEQQLSKQYAATAGKGLGLGGRSDRGEEGGGTDD